MAEKKGMASSFVAVRTIHEAEVSWWWHDSVLHDTGYHIKVNDSMAKKMKALETKYDVTNDTRYCCQFEGMLLNGENRVNVEAAGLELARHLARFKSVFPLNGDD